MSGSAKSWMAMPTRSDRRDRPLSGPTVLLPATRSAARKEMWPFRNTVPAVSVKFRVCNTQQ